MLSITGSNWLKFSWPKDKKCNTKLSESFPGVPSQRVIFFHVYYAQQIKVDYITQNLIDKTFLSQMLLSRNRFIGDFHKRAI